MWYWLRRNTHERTILLTILIVSAVIHAGFLAWFFFGFKDRSSHLSFLVTPEMLNNNVEFVFGPVKQQAKSGKKTTSAQSASKKIQKKEKSVDAKKLDMKTSVAQKKVAKAPAQKKASQKKSPKAVEKKIAEAKKDPEPVKAPEPIKHEPEKKAEPELKQPVASDPIALSTNESGTIQQQIGIHERGLLDEYVTFQKEIVAVWTPPPGIAHDCACLISIMVDWQGAVKDITIEKSSGVLVYDASARAALAKLEMPRWTWGKTITITFNQ